jgi:exodeoxyribonuclease VII large subunit
VKIATLQAKNSELASALNRLANHMQEKKQASFQSLVQKLNTLSPLSTLQRGYAIVSTSDDHIIRRADEVSKGDMIKARLEEGQVVAEVQSVSMENKS